MSAPQQYATRAALLRRIDAMPHLRSMAFAPGRHERKDSGPGQCVPASGRTTTIAGRHVDQIEKTAVAHGPASPRHLDGGCGRPQSKALPAVINDLAASRPGFTGYLGTPSGTFL